MREQKIEAEANQKRPLYSRIFNIISTKINWSLDYGVTYQRWNKVVNAMIEKIPGKPLTNKLRIIHLIESDFNLMIGILWGRWLVFQNEQDNEIDEGQSGSSQDLLSMKNSIISVWRMSKFDGVFFGNDAKSCFERIVMTLGSMPKRACITFLNTL